MCIISKLSQPSFNAFISICGPIAKSYKPVYAVFFYLPALDVYGHYSHAKVNN